MRVVDDKIAVRVNDSGAAKTASGLHLVQTAENSQVLKGEVILTGPDLGASAWAEEGTEPEIIPGAVVHFNRFNAIQVVTSDGSLWVLKFTDVLVIE